MSVLACGYFVVRRRQADRAEKYVGTVTGIVPSGAGEGTMFSPEVSFQNFDGHTIEFRSRRGSFPSRWQVGDPIWVIILERGPEIHDDGLLAEGCAFTFVAGLMIATSQVVTY